MIVLYGLIVVGAAVGVVAGGIWRMRREFVDNPAYAGRHRGPGRATRRASRRLHEMAARARQNYVVYQQLVASVVDPVAAWLPALAYHDGVPDALDRPAPVQRRYQSLAPRVLDAHARVDVVAARLAVRSPWGTPAEVDVWEPRELVRR